MRSIPGVFSLLGLAASAFAFEGGFDSSERARPAEPSAVAALPPQPESPGEIRARLLPILEDTLSRHCGEACPSFKLEWELAKQKPTSLDHLGFTTRSAASSKEPKALLVTVLAQKTVAQASRATLQQIVAHRLANEVEVPVRVRIRELAAPPPSGALAAKPLAPASPHWSEQARPFAWPAALITAFVLALAGLAYLLRHRSREALAAWRRNQPAKTETQKVAAETSGEARALLAGRLDDLKHAVEDSSHRPDELARYLRVCGDEIRALRLAPLALPLIAQAAEKAVPAPVTPEDLAWLRARLDRAHWRRAEIESHPVSRVAQATEQEIACVARELDGDFDRANLLAVLGPERWATAMGAWGREERIRVGIELAELPKRDEGSRRDSVSRVVSLFASLESPVTVPDRVVEDYSMMLSGPEGRELWTRLSAKGKKAEALSMEAIFERMDSRALLEACMQLTPDALATLLSEVSPSVKNRVCTTLPVGLRTRVEASRGMDPLQARAELAGAIRGLRVAAAGIAGAENAASGAWLSESGTATEAEGTA